MRAALHALRDWGDVAARARGLSTRALPRKALHGLAMAPDLATAAAQLSAWGRVPSTARDARSLEHALRRDRALQTKILARWCGPRVDALAVLFEDEDRRSLVLLLRHAASGRSRADPLAGLTPTPGLPPAALTTLAEQPDPGRIAALLTAWGHPFGVPLLEATTGPPVDLPALEGSLHLAFAARAAGSARHGDRVLRNWVRATIDAENLRALLVAARQPPGSVAPPLLPGGMLLDTAVHAAVLAAPAQARSTLRASLAGTPLGPLVDTEGFERAWLASQLNDQRRASRRAPLTTAPLLAWLLRLRAEAMDLRTILWGLTLGAPGPEITRRLVSP